MKTAHRAKHHASTDYDLYGDLEKIKAAIAETTRDARGKASSLITESIENAKDKSDELQENVMDYVADKPFKSLGLALLAGMIVGYFLHK